MKTAKAKPKYLVLRDTREQEQGNRWTFPVSETCEGTTEQTIKTGDYTLRGYEHILCVERKASTAEVSMNMYQARFTRELERMEAFKHAYLICEFTIADIVSFPFKSGIPQNKWKQLKTTPQLMMKKLIEFQLRFKTKWIFAGSDGRSFCSSLFKRIVENEEIQTTG